MFNLITAVGVVPTEEKRRIAWEQFFREVISELGTVPALQQLLPTDVDSSEARVIVQEYVDGIMEQLPPETQLRLCQAMMAYLVRMLPEAAFHALWHTSMQPIRGCEPPHRCTSGI